MNVFIGILRTDFKDILPFTSMPESKNLRHKKQRDQCPLYYESGFHLLYKKCQIENFMQLFIQHGSIYSL